MVPCLVNRRPSAVVLLLVTCSLLAAPGAAPAAPDASTAISASCFGASIAATKAARVTATRAVRCLVNAERRKYGLAPVITAWKLQRSASRHSALMLRTGIFDHRLPGEADLAGRIRGTGYLVRARRWAIGEALALSDGGSASAATLMHSLMESQPHRAIILDRAFRELGVGLQEGTPEAAGRPGAGATLTLNFGLRRAD